MSKLFISDDSTKDLLNDLINLYDQPSLHNLVLLDHDETIESNRLDLNQDLISSEFKKQSLKHPSLLNKLSCLKKYHFIIVTQHRQTIEKYLAKLIDFTNSTVFLQQQPYFLNRKPIYLSSIPKAGTHLLLKLVKLLGYNFTIPSGFHLPPKTYSYIEHSNFHTIPKNFFVDTVYRTPHGNRLHDFATTPCLFLFRHPLDVLVSEASYHHKKNNTPYSTYLSSLDFDERVNRLIDDTYMLGSISHRIGQYTPWLDFSNVIPIPFEDLIGSKGQGNDIIQHKLVWSLQLRLHVAGTTNEIANQLFDESSPTYRSGNIGNFKEHLSERQLYRIKKQPQEFMTRLGYNYKNPTSKLSANFIAKQIKVAPSVEANEPILIEANYFCFNIIYFNNIFYGIPHGTCFNPKNIRNEKNILIKSSKLYEIKQLIIESIMSTKLGSKHKNIT